MLLTWWRTAPWLTVSTAVGLAILLTLGTWQVQRLQWKEALIAEIEAGLSAPPRPLPVDGSSLDRLNYHRVSVRGRLLHDREQSLGPRQHTRQPGRHLLTPMALSDGRHLLVNRGWLPERPGDADVARPAGDLELTGVLRTGFRRGTFTPDYDAGAAMWFWYDIDGISARTGLTLLPAVLEADDDGEGLPFGGVTEVNIANNHLHYALTWYGLAAALICVFVIFQRQRSAA